MFKLIFDKDAYCVQLISELLNEKCRPGEFQRVTLRPLLASDKVNDLGLQVGGDFLCLVEAQSTPPTNISLRMLGYITRTIEQYIRDIRANIYGSTLIEVPVPRLFVVYTGDAEVPKEYTFFEHVGRGDLNLRVHVKTVNNVVPGGVLYQYILFCNIFTKWRAKHLSFGKMCEGIITECISSGIFPDLINMYSPEVRRVLSYEEQIALSHELEREDWERQMYPKIKKEVTAKVRQEVREEMEEEVREQVTAEVREQVAVEVREQIREQVAVEVREQLREQVAVEVQEAVVRNIAKSLGISVEQARKAALGQVPPKQAGTSGIGKMRLPD